MALEPVSSSQRLAVVDHNPARQHNDIIEPFVDEWWAGMDGDTHVIQVKERGRVVEYEMQVSVGSGHHIVKSI